MKTELQALPVFEQASDTQRRGHIAFKERGDRMSWADELTGLMSVYFSDQMD